MRVNFVLLRVVLAGLVASPAIAEDRLKIDAIADSDNVVVMIDARTSAGAGGCGNDRISRSTGESALGNLRSAGGCRSEIAIFPSGNAMLLEKATWTNQAEDVHTSTLNPIIDAPVIVWIANPAAANKAVDDMAR